MVVVERVGGFAPQGRDRDREFQQQCP